MEIQIEVIKVGARVYLHVKYVQFEKAAQMGYHLMPDSIDKEHFKMI